MQKAHPLLESAAGRLYGYYIWGPPRQRLSESMEKCTLYLSTCQIMSWFRQAVCLPRDASQDQPTSSGWNQTMPSLTNIIKLAPETIVKYLPLVSAWVSAYRNPMNFQVPLHGGPWPSRPVQSPQCALMIPALGHLPGHSIAPVIASILRNPPSPICALKAPAPGGNGSFLSYLARAA
jgi:hypothetical protein